MDALRQDLRYAIRTLLRSPGFAAIAVLTLALGIGATTAIFSVVNGVLLKALPYPEPERVMRLWEVGDGGGRSNFSDPNFSDLREQSRSFAALAELGKGGITPVTGGAEPVRAAYSAVSREFFDVLGVRPVLGRTFTAEEQREGGAPAVLVSYGYWQRSLGGTRDLAGRRLTFDDETYTVVGVMPPGFNFPDGTELWTPRERWGQAGSRTALNWQVFGRLADGVSLEQARQETSAIAARLKQQYGDDTWMRDAAVMPLREELVGRVRPALLVLLAAAGFLLLVAAANVANLLLARAASRQRELAVRSALGAGRARMVRQFLAESLVLALVGGGLGVLLAVWGVALLPAFEAGALPRAEEIRVDWPVLAFALALAVLVAVGLGLGAAWRATGAGARAALSASQRTHAAGGASRSARGALVASQVALTLVLLVGTGLMIRSILRLLSVDAGYRTEGAVTMSLTLPAPRNNAAELRLTQFHRELTERLRRIPGVQQVGGINAFPLSGGGANGTFLILNRPDEVTNFQEFGALAKNPERSANAAYRIASEEYFRTMRIPLLRGRLFEESDGPDAPHVAVISRSLAEKRWPNEDPIGKLIQYANMDGDFRPFTVVGVVGDVREQSLEAEPQPTFYGYTLQRPGSTYVFTYALAGTADPARMITAAGEIIRELAPDVPPRFATLEEVVAAPLAPRRFILRLLGVFGCTAMLLAAMGIYGVVSYAVAQRTREIGIRMALGAAQGAVVELVLRQGIVATAAGIVAGIAGALALTRLIAGLLYGVSATDPLTLTVVSLLLGGVTTLAAYLPARRAARVDPMVALRAE